MLLGVKVRKTYRCIVGACWNSSATLRTGPDMASTIVSEQTMGLGGTNTHRLHGAPALFVYALPTHTTHLYRVLGSLSS
jgi:hypothetical protein